MAGFGWLNTRNRRPYLLAGVFKDLAPEKWGAKKRKTGVLVGLHGVIGTLYGKRWRRRDPPGTWGNCPSPAVFFSQYCNVVSLDPSRGLPPAVKCGGRHEVSG